MKLSYTRAMVNAAIRGELDNVGFDNDPIFDWLCCRMPGGSAEVLKR
jgi:ATP-dependent phosphoenolpyruvate carboxykinase